MNPKKSFGDGLFEYVDLGAVNQDEKRITGSRRIPGYDAPSRAKQVLAVGDVLVSTVRPNLNAVARVGDEFDGVIGSTGFCVLRPDKHLDSGYLFQWVRSPQFVQRMVRAATGASYPAVSDRIVRESMIPLPDVREQRRIAQVLDATDALRAMRREALSQIKSLTEAIFVEMFGDSASNSRGWPTRQLGHAAQFFAGASLPHGCRYDGQEDGFFLIKVSDMNRPGNERNIETCAEWSEGPGARSATCPPFSIIFPKRGAAIGTNKKRITTRSCVLDPNLMAVYPDRDMIHLEYLFEWFLHFDLKRITSGSSVPQLNKRDLAPLPIPVPPLDLQDEFARHIEAIECARTSARSQLDDLDALFASLQDRAFKGEL